MGRISDRSKMRASRSEIDPAKVGERDNWMKEEKTGWQVPCLLGAIIGIAIGYGAFGNQSDLKRLRSELARVERAGAARIGPRLSTAFQSTRPSGTSPAGAGAAMSKEDLERSRALKERKAQGDYVLRDKFPAAQKAAEAIHGNLVSHIASANATDLDQVFARLGISPEVSKQLQNHRRLIIAAELTLPFRVERWW